MSKSFKQLQDLLLGAYVGQEISGPDVSTGTMTEAFDRNLEIGPTSEVDGGVVVGVVSSQGMGSETDGLTGEVRRVCDTKFYVEIGVLASGIPGSVLANNWPTMMQEMVNLLELEVQPATGVNVNLLGWSFKEPRRSRAKDFYKLRLEPRLKHLWVREE